MTVNDLYLLSPEIAMAAIAGIVVLVDLLVRRPRLVAMLGFVGLIVPLGLTILLWSYVLRNGSEVGIYGTLVVDEFAIFFKFVVIFIVGAVFLGSADYVAKLQNFQGEFYALLLLSAVGMMLLAATTELISIYVSLELTSLPLAALIAFAKDGRSTEAGIKFLILSGISSALLLYGMVLVYGFIGSTELGHIAQGIIAGDIPFGSYATLVGAAMIIAGFGFKVSMFPFQMWVPDVYEGSPTPVAAYLSVASKAAGFAVLLRVFYVAFESVDTDWNTLFAILSALSMTIGNLLAMVQANIKRLLAYSTIAHAGYMLVGFAVTMGQQEMAPVGLGPSGVLFYLVAYAFTNLAAFFAIMALTNRSGSEDINSLAGMARRGPIVSFVLAFAFVSLIGIPPTAGFMGKLYLFNAAVQSGLVWLAIVGVVNSVISSYYYLKVVRIMYVSTTEEQETIESSLAVRVALGVTSVATLFLGIFPGTLLRITELVSTSLVS
ncbi:MAG: hypothetical protein BZY82_06940 [SAR202 cluster bacterium Io17-Chloro-G3]|nr:MAG: hypothetical protein BZY82_06940 [SAR202 cluster bacterium Io17-Chloro-G3]